MWSQLAFSLQHGNLYVIFVLAFGFLGTIILFERLIMLMMVYHIDFHKFVSNFKKIVQAEDLDRAINLCKSVSKTSLPYISLRALEAAERDPTSVRGTIEEETIDFLPKIEARLGMLPSLGTIILLIGILGTIDGLWGAFNSIAVLDTSEKQARLAQGIAGSLNPTALALLLSMIFIAGYYLLKGMAIRLTDRIHHGVAVLNNLLVPQEINYVAAPAMAAPVAAPAHDTSIDYSDHDKEPAVAASSPPAEEDDTFDEASVEDIKDEEEII